MYKPDKILFLKSLIFPLSFTVFLWAIKIAELCFNQNFFWLGIYPLKFSGLIGIVTAPLIHADINHLLSNTFGVLFLSWAIFYFYTKVAQRAFILIYVLSGFWVWFFAREAYHIGASGLIYGMASFLFFSGIFRKHVPLIAVSLTIVFLYGGIIWGIFPTFEKISWETHLTGLIAGIIVAVYYKNEGPQRPQPFYDSEEETDDNNEINDNLDENGNSENIEQNNSVDVKYHYKKEQ